MEHRHLQGVDVLLEHVVDLFGGYLLALLDESHILHGGQQFVVVLIHRVAQHLAQLNGPSTGHRRHRAEVDDTHPVSGHQHEIAGVGVAMDHLEPPRRVIAELEQPGGHQVALFLGAVGDDVRQRNAVDPLLDDDLGGAGHHVRHHEFRVALVSLGEGPLIVGLEPVVELHLGARDQLIDDPLDVRAGGELPEYADHPLHRLEVRPQRLVGAGVLDFYRNLAAVGPDRLVDLADAGRGDRRVVKRLEPLSPLGAQLRVEHPVHLGRRQRRGLALQLGQRLAVGLAVLLGDRSLHDRESLADLHRAALELAEHGE